MIFFTFFVLVFIIWSHSVYIRYIIIFCVGYNVFIYLFLIEICFYFVWRFVFNRFFYPLSITLFSCNFKGKTNRNGKPAQVDKLFCLWNFYKLPSLYTIHVHMTFLESYFPECFLNSVYLLQIVSPSELSCILNRYSIYYKKNLRS